MLTPVEEDRDHITYADGRVFHVQGGQITSSDRSCPCGDPEPVHQITSFREAVPQLQISLTDACNMGCTYCSFRDRVHADDKPVSMPLEIAKRGIAAYQDHVVDQDARYGRIDFGLAGETMLVRHMHEEVHRLIEEGLADSPLAVIWNGPMVTNATLSMAPELADRIGPPQDISVDGPKDVHDRVRFYTNNRGGTYDDVRSVLDRVLARHPDMGVSAVLTAYCTDFSMIFRHLFEDIGARNIYMKPVNATHDKDYSLNADTLPDFQRGYAETIEDILSHEPQGILDRLLALNSEDYFMRFFYRVKDRAAQIYRCGAGKSGVYLDTNGRLYPCAHFIGKSGWDIGHAATGVDEAKRRQYLDLTVDTREPCRSCSARYVCGGGCHYQAVLANGNIHEPDAVKCDLIRFLTNLAIRLVVFLREHHPEVLNALPSPFGISPQATTLPAEAPYQPLGYLTATADPRPLMLGGPGRVRRGLSSADPMAATIEIVDGQLSASVELPTDPDLVQSLRLWLQPLGGDAFTMRDLSVRKPGDSGHLLRLTPDEASWLVVRDDRFRRVPYEPAAWRRANDVEATWSTDRIQFSVDLPGTVGSLFGVNLFMDLSGGGWTALAVHEPFLALSASAVGPLSVVGPEAPAAPDADSQDDDGGMPSMLTPLGRWTGLQGNVC